MDRALPTPFRFASLPGWLMSMRPCRRKHSGYLHLPVIRPHPDACARALAAGHAFAMHTQVALDGEVGRGAL
jgi:hypothetical protein